jgi:hypothetical protein
LVQVRDVKAHRELARFNFPDSQFLTFDLDGTLLETVIDCSSRLSAASAPWRGVDASTPPEVLEERAKKVDNRF